MASGDLVPERIDQGVDYGISGGSGTVYALGPGTITTLCATSGTGCGWDYGGYDSFIAEQLSAGPAYGLYVYVAEDCVPVSGLSLGEQVTADTALCNITVPNDSGIETGWSSGVGEQPESQTSQAGSINGSSACIENSVPTLIGENYNSLLVALGATSGVHSSPGTCGLLPPNWPTNW
jgi:hypothetical protein